MAPLHLLLPVWLWLLSSIGGGWVAVDTPKMAWLRRVEGVVLDVHRERLIGELTAAIGLTLELRLGGVAIVPSNHIGVARGTPTVGRGRLGGREVAVRDWSRAYKRCGHRLFRL